MACAPRPKRGWRDRDDAVEKDEIWPPVREVSNKGRSIESERFFWWPTILAGIVWSYDRYQGVTMCRMKKDVGMLAAIPPKLLH